VLELVDRHDSGSCVRKGVGVRFSPRASLIRGFMKIVLLVLVALVVTGCERYSRPVAGKKDAPASAPKYSVDPKANIPAE
jgi:hypothetical protein